MDLMRRYRRLLQTGPIKAEEPQNLYPQVSVRDNDTEITAVYSAEESLLSENSRKKPSLSMVQRQQKSISNRKRNSCQSDSKKIVIGEIVEEKDVILAGITELPCTAAGRLEIIKQM